ncbi:hypothetical protein HYZ82_01965 [Candidatus Nomurabacteria bacterium]|nr:hypothetical protein [Candidatus Nomurabacteria bacterium]
MPPETKIPNNFEIDQALKEFETLFLQISSVLDSKEYFMSNFNVFS